MPSHPTVEFCTRNVDMDSYRALRRSEAEVRQHHCLEQCGSCRESPFLVVDGSLVRGDHEALLDRLTGEPREDADDA